MFAKTYVSFSRKQKDIHGDHYEIATPTISIKLDDANYSVWSQILKMHIVGRKKGYITGRKVALTEENPNYDEWEVKHALVKS